MNFVEYKDTYFAGNSPKALEQLAKESYTRKYTFCKTADDLQVVLDSMDKKTANEFMDFLQDEIEKNPKPLKYAVNIAMLSGSVGLGIDEVIKTKKNPFVRKFIFDILIILGGIVIFAILLLLKNNMDINSNTYDHVVGMVPLLFISLRSPAAASNLINIFRFNKLKKLINGDKKLCSHECYPITGDENFSVDLDTTTNDNFVDLPDLQGKETITRSYIVKFLRAYYRDQRKASLVIGIIMSALFGGLSFASGIQCVAIPLFFASLIVFLFVHIRARIKLKRTEALDFYIEIDKCVTKEVKIDNEDHSVRGRYLFFEKHGKYRINFQHSGMFISTFTESELYDSVDIEDKCYVVLFDSDSKIQMVLPKKMFYFSAEEFELNNNKYYPIKTANATALISEEIQVQQKELSERQANAIEETNKSIKSAKSKNRGLATCSIIGISFTFLGAFIEVICAFNLFVQPLLFAIPIVISFVATRKTKKAFDKVRSNYVSYSELHYEQNSVAGKTLAFIAIDVFAYLFNFLFIILIHMK